MPCDRAVGQAGLESLRRHAHALRLEHCGPVGRKIVDAGRGDRLDGRTNSGQRNDQEVEDEAWVDTGADHRGAVRAGKIGHLRRDRRRTAGGIGHLLGDRHDGNALA